jgi:DNA-binding MarR family transcriptional regulator
VADRLQSDAAVSRGLGRTQREAMLALWHHEEGLAAGMPLAELKRSISTDRSNARRAIRGLIERGFAVALTGEAGERRVALTGGAHMALWLATEYRDEALTLEKVPSRPLNLDLGDDLGIVEEDALDLDNPMSLGKPHEPSPPPPDRPVSDNAPSSRGHKDAVQTGVGHANAPLPPERGVSDHEERTPGRGDPMQGGIPHASTPRPPNRPVSDPSEATYTPGRIGLEIAARMAREWLDRLDAEDAEEGKA